MEKLSAVIESLIKENYYEKEFVEWIWDENNSLIVDTIYSENLSLDELYQYWLTEKSKEK